MNKMEKIKNWYENLDQINLNNIEMFYANDVFFKDPFNQVRGVGPVKRIFKHMFESLDRPRFIFIDLIENQQNAFITWDFVFSLKGREFKIHGSSHLKFNEENKIVYHRDYWDVGEELLLKVPIIKNIYQIIRTKFSST